MNGVVRFSAQGWGERGRRPTSLFPRRSRKINGGHVHRQKLQATEILRATGFNLGAGTRVSGSRGRIVHNFGFMGVFFDGAWVERTRIFGREPKRIDGGVQVDSRDIRKKACQLGSVLQRKRQGVKSQEGVGR
jgi:hypothetical protein